MKKSLAIMLALGLLLALGGCCAGQSGHVPCVPWPLAIFFAD
jgi:hypothetical protein